MFRQLANRFELFNVYWELIYSKASKIRTSIFQNTRSLEINLGHTGCRDCSVAMIYLNKIVYNNMFWCEHVKKTSLRDASFIYPKQVFWWGEKLIQIIFGYLPNYNSNNCLFEIKSPVPTGIRVNEILLFW